MEVKQALLYDQRSYRVVVSDMRYMYMYCRHGCQCGLKGGVGGLVSVGNVVVFPFF